MLVPPEVATLLSAPALGGAARALCGALQAPDIHSATLRDSLDTLVQDARAAAIPLAQLRRALSLMVSECARVPANDRAGISEYVLRRAAMLYDEFPLAV